MTGRGRHAARGARYARLRWVMARQAACAGTTEEARVDPGTRLANQVLVLWDVDHTLTANGGASKHVYARAFELLTGSPAVSPGTDGRTDPQTMSNMLADHGLPVSDAYVVRIPEALAAAMADKALSLRELGHALPGAHAAPEALRDVPGVIQTVLSGNIRPNALAKLAAFGLDADPTSRSAVTTLTIPSARIWWVLPGNGLAPGRGRCWMHRAQC